MRDMWQEQEAERTRAPHVIGNKTGNKCKRVTWITQMNCANCERNAKVTRAKTGEVNTHAQCMAIVGMDA